MTDTYFAIVALVAIARYLVLRRPMRPAEPRASRKEAGRLFASLTDEEQKAVLARMRAEAKKRRKKRD